MQFAAKILDKGIWLDSENGGVHYFCRPLWKKRSPSKELAWGADDWPERQLLYPGCHSFPKKLNFGAGSPNVEDCTMLGTTPPISITDIREHLG